MGTFKVGYKKNNVEVVGILETKISVAKQDETRRFFSGSWECISNSMECSYAAQGETTLSGSNGDQAAGKQTPLSCNNN